MVHIFDSFFCISCLLTAHNLAKDDSALKKNTKVMKSAVVGVVHEDNLYLRTLPSSTGTNTLDFIMLCILPDSESLVKSCVFLTKKTRFFISTAHCRHEVLDRLYRSVNSIYACMTEVMKGGEDLT